MSKTTFFRKIEEVGHYVPSAVEQPSHSVHELRQQTIGLHDNSVALINQSKHIWLALIITKAIINHFIPIKFAVHSLLTIFVVMVPCIDSMVGTRRFTPIVAQEPATSPA
jgi:hypothetical protein